LINPTDEMVLEGAFDELVEEIRCQKFVNVSTWKAFSERLEL